MGAAEGRFRQVGTLRKGLYISRRQAIRSNGVNFMIQGEIYQVEWRLVEADNGVKGTLTFDPIDGAKLDRVFGEDV